MTLYSAVLETGEVLIRCNAELRSGERDLCGVNLWGVGSPDFLARAARHELSHRDGPQLATVADKRRWAIACAVLRYLDLPGDRWRWQ